MSTPRIFICYSHSDKYWKDQLVSQLKPLEEEGLLRLWVDDLIEDGADWHIAICKAINEADVAVFMVSADSLVSRFIRDEEIPRLIERRTYEGMDFIPVIARDCVWKKVPWLSKFQALPREGKSLSSCRSRKDSELQKIADAILAAARKDVQVSTAVEAIQQIQPTRPEKTLRRFFHHSVLSELEERLDGSPNHLCVLGLPGTGISTTLKQLVSRRRDALVLDSRTLSNPVEATLPADGVVAVFGYPGVNWLAKLQTLANPKRVRIAAGSAVAPASMDPVLMTPLSDDDLLSMLGECFASRVQDIARITGRSPGAVRKLLSLARELDSSNLTEIETQLWGEREVSDAARALADLDFRNRAFLATLAIRGGVSPVGKELWIRLLAAASMEKYSTLEARNPLSPFLLPTEGGGVVLRPEIARVIEQSGYREAVPRLGARVLFVFEHASQIHKLIISVGRGTFREVLDDARTIALTKTSAPSVASTTCTSDLVELPGSLGPEEEAHVWTTWRVLVHVVQLLPDGKDYGNGQRLWHQLNSALVLARDIGVRLNEGEVLLRDLLREVEDELQFCPHWRLMWCREAIPGPLINEISHHDPGIVPEVNAVVLGAGDVLFSADSAGFVYKWHWEGRGGGKYGGQKVQQSEVWSIAVVDEEVVISASDDGSIAVRSGAWVHKQQLRSGAMINTVVVSDGLVVAGDDDSVLHLWRLITEEGGSPRLVKHEVIGNAGAGWTLGCLAVSRDEVYSSHQHGVAFRWLRSGPGGWLRSEIIRSGADVWIRTLRREASTGAIFAACSDGKILRYDPGTNSVEAFADHGTSVRGMTLLDHATESFLATGGDDGVIRLWTAAGAEISSFGAHRGMVRALDSRSSLLASCGTDGFVRLWSLGPSQHPPKIEAMDADGMVVHLATGNRCRAFLASTGYETSLVKSLGTAHPLQISGREISTQRGEIELPTVCKGAMLSSDGSRVLASDTGGRIYFFTWSSI